MSKIASISTSEAIGPGAIVMLKTGGPTLVVTERTADKVHVYWHDNEGAMYDIWIPTIAVKVKS